MSGEPAAQVMSETASNESEPARRKLSEIIDEVFDPKRHPSSYGQLVDELDHHGIAVILILFSIPSALPVPAAGYSTVLSVPLMIIGVRLFLGYESLWLPEKARQREFRPAHFEKLHRLMSRLVCFIERYSKPRFVGLVQSGITRIFLALLICALALSMALPIPGTNTLPAGGIFLIGFALLEDDGLLLLLGIIYSCLALCASIAVILLGKEAVKLAISSVFQ